MGKRKLTRRQAWRIKKIQQDRLARAEKKRGSLIGDLSPDELGPEQDGVIIAHFGATLDVEDRNGILSRCVARQNLGNLVCGDEVIWQAGYDNTGVITALKPRHTLLSRPDFHQQLKPIAANIDQILIVTAPKPGIREDLIDRYLVAAENTHITPVIVINKIDLLSANEFEELKQRLNVYMEIGYQSIYTSTKLSHGMDSLIQCLKDKTNVFVGLSGVGKSSLIKTLLPDIDIRIGELSQATGQGKHTTTVTRLYHFPAGGHLIDSPGVRDFALWNMSAAEIAYGFIEFRPYLGLCKFSNCTHSIEPECAIKRAVRQHRIKQSRLDRYHRIVNSFQAEQV
jgi:ribosome biogenesis GTPase